MQEGTAALAGYGRIFRETVALTGVVPQISIVSGASAGGGAYSPALTDLILMTEDAAMFLTGPGVVREALGEEIDAAALGGPRVHDRNGVCHLVEHDELAPPLGFASCSATCRQRAGERRRVPAASSRLDDPGAVVPPSRGAPTTCATRCGGIVDGGSLLELCPRWARNVVTTFARIDGRPVGDRRQPAALSGRRARRRGLREGGAVRAASATRSGCR